MTQTFPIVPAPAKALWVLAAVAGLLIALLLLFVYIAYSSRHVRFEISPEGLRVRGSMYGRQIAAQALLVDKAAAVDLAEHRDLAPRWRSNGVGLPGYSAGWFRLRGGERGLLFVTDRSRVVHIPTTLGYEVLLSVPDPEAFLSALRETGTK